MKGFFTTFMICCVFALIFLCFGVGLFYEFLFESIPGIVIVVALPLSIFIHTVVSLEDKIAALEKRLNELEGKKEMEEDGTK